MSARIVEIELLREENAELRAAIEREVAAREAQIADRDEVIAAKDEQLVALARQLHLTQEELEYLRKRFFGKKTEKLPPGLSLFEEVAEPPPPEPAPDDEGSLLTEREKRKARRKPRGRKSLPAHLPRVRV